MDSITTTIGPENGFALDAAQLAAASLLARYSGRTLEAYFHDLRGYFQWAADNHRPSVVSFLSLACRGEGGTMP